MPIIKIIKLHNAKINSVSNYLDESNKRDLVITSSNDKTINILKCDNYSNIFNITHDKPVITANINFMIRKCI